MSEIIQKISSHRLMLDGRERLSISGVEDVISFDDSIVILKTVMGILTVDGAELRITTLNVDTGEVDICGTVSGIVYQGDRAPKGRLFKRKG